MRSALMPPRGAIWRNSGVPAAILACAIQRSRTRHSAESAGRPMALADAQIAAIALVAHAPLATRNGSDFSSTRLVLINPWLGN